jgi:3-oxoacyl-(acyl-carrier-protein) synthase
MSRSLAITGTGAVSAAGWGVEALMKALDGGEMPAPILLERVCGEDIISTPALRVPMDAATIPKVARLRRASPISKFAASAAMEALGEERLAAIRDGLRVGVILTLTNGCVNYSNRFFSEVLSDPALASPILFPETVFNAPSSHLSAMIGSNSPNDSLIGDSSGFLTGMDLAAEWIERGDVDGCIVVAAEEIDWLSAEGLCLYSKHLLPSEGAAAIYLEAGDGPVILHELPDPVPYQRMKRPLAVLEMKRLLEEKGVADDGRTLLIDGLCGVATVDRAERQAWQDWIGPRSSPKQVIGETMGAAAGFQVVAAAASLTRETQHSIDRALIFSAGANQQVAALAIGR